MSGKKLKTNPYYIALDIGTASVGWAVLNDNYMLEKHKNKNMWGVRLFEEGESAKKTRLHRSARRTLSRKKQRIALLKELIGPMVLDVDESFFMRLEKGYMHEGDRGYHYNLFVEDGFNDKEYYEKYPTIYHLRKELCESEEKADPRLIYLAIHHILKHRGHFLYETDSFNLSNHDDILESLQEALSKVLIQFDDLNIEYNLSNVLEVLLDKNKSNKVKEDLFLKCFNGLDKNSKKTINELFKLLNGYKANLSAVFVHLDLSELEGKSKLSFASELDDDTESKLQKVLDENFDILENLKSVYDYMILNELLRGKTSLSDAMVSIYEQHEKDLSNLKHILKKYYDDEVYLKVFKEDNSSYYKKYVGKVSGGKKNGDSSDKKSLLTQRDLCDNLKKLLKANNDYMESVEGKELLERLDNNDFLPKQKTVDNHAIPHQLHKDELIKILNNQAKYYPDLEKNKDKIISLLTFRIPYYVGPTNPASKRFAWIIRKGESLITPWTFNDEVDIDKTAELFIRRMTNNCTYLLGEPVVAKNSLLYSRFELLNELNKIRINGKFLDLKEKDQVIKELFLKNQTVTLDRFKKYVISHQLVHANEPIEITGTQKEDKFASSLYPWIVFKKIYGDDFDRKFYEIETLIE